MITGGLGFIGSHLAEKLCNKHNIVILTKTNSKIKNVSHISNKLKIEKVDVTNFSKLQKSIKLNKPDVIFHLAGETSHSKSFDNPIYDLDLNAKSTLYLLEIIKKLNLKCRIILGSTFIVVGRPQKLPVTEETPCNPTTIYGTNRLTSENYCKIYHSLYGLDVVIFRITNSFGPREQITSNKNAVNFLIYKASKKEDVTIFNQGKFFRDLIYVSDVISGLEIIMKKGKSGNLYWISSGKKIWFDKLGKMLENLTKTKVKYVSASKYAKKVDVGNFIVDNSKLKSLGWKPKIPIKEGIKNTIEYFKHEKII